MAPLDIALINNASPASFQGTLTQFQTLLERAAGGRAIRLHVARFGSAEATPGEFGCETVDRLLAGCAFDGAIITGAEPSCADLENEPFWGELTEVLRWAETGGVPLVLSCLAAHATVQFATGLRRTRMATKCFGVFEHETMGDHPLLRGVPARFPMPHSRWNRLDAASLEAAGYRILTHSAVAGVETFVGGRSGRDMFCQGHPEYGADTLKREYRRDVGRFLDGRSDRYPALPVGVYDAATVRACDLFEARATGRGPVSLSELSFAKERVAPAPWASVAATIFGHWIAGLSAGPSHAVHPKVLLRSSHDVPLWN
jgi:homoserine O-succinyltransferase